VTVAAIALPAGQAMAVEGVLEGTIAEEPSGNHGFGYDPVFVVPEYGRTLAELSAEVKNRISHRARAFGKAKQLLRRMTLESNPVGA
jgi:XTP/dITP diphosphohydrolase